MPRSPFQPSTFNHHALDLEQTGVGDLQHTTSIRSCLCVFCLPHPVVLSRHGKPVPSTSTSPTVFRLRPPICQASTYERTSGIATPVTAPWLKLMASKIYSTIRRQSSTAVADEANNIDLISDHCITLAGAAV